MKILHSLSLFAVLTIVSCKNEQKAEPLSQKEHPEQITDSLPKFTVDHNSENSLDWAGAYKGSLPCPDCPGITTELTLNTDGTYVLSSQSENKDKTPYIYKGTFAWDDTGSIVTLDAEGDHLKFKVQEGCLKMLDKFGEPKQGKGNYILGKKQ